uniref:ABC transmembrane type-1 domain-containing protein n=1 Tax=Aegilops tauschii subsp. strangulata TaxID=200361 RepID=A0A453QS90_AEGTS
ASAKELMRINGTTKSALVNHLGESISGAITIRAFGEEDRFFAKNLDLVDKNAGPYFCNFAATEWLIQRLEIMSASVLSFSAFVMALLPQGTFSPGFCGNGIVLWSFAKCVLCLLYSKPMQPCESDNISGTGEPVHGHTK